MAKTDPADTPPADDPPQTAELDAEMARARVAELEAELAATRERRAASVAAWIVVYPAISVQPKDPAGNPAGEPVTLDKGAKLPPECEWAGPFLKSIGHVTLLQVLAD